MDEQKQDEELQEEISEIEQTAEQPVEQPLRDVQESVEEAVKTEQPQELPKKLVEQPKQIGAPMPGKMERLKAFIVECKRVLRVTKKPDKQEYLTIVKISSIGMAIIGVVGFLVHFAKELLF
jgi:protein transport protein SEC61 subunit gamma-like protein